MKHLIASGAHHFENGSRLYNLVRWKHDFTNGVINTLILMKLLLNLRNASMEKEKAIKLLEIILILAIFSAIVGGVISLLFSLN